MKNLMASLVFLCLSIGCFGQNAPSETDSPSPSQKFICNEPLPRRDARDNEIVARCVNVDLDYEREAIYFSFTGSVHSDPVEQKPDYKYGFSFSVSINGKEYVNDYSALPGWTYHSKNGQTIFEIGGRFRANDLDNLDLKIKMDHWDKDGNSIDTFTLMQGELKTWYEK